MKRIWKILHDLGSISFSYQAFTVHVNRLILFDNKQEIHTKEESKSVKKQTAKPDEQQQVTQK
jgi:hypothetical protein